MSQSAVKLEQIPANDSAFHAVTDEADAGKSVNQYSVSDRSTSGDNPVRQAVEDFKNLIDEMDDLREMLRAHGIPLRTTRMIVEFGVQNKPDKQTMALESAMEQAEKTFGEGVLSREALENHISTIVNLERDLSHARAVAREEGLDAQALSILTQMVQQNPGDGGAKAVSTFLGYAVAYGVKTDQLADIARELTSRPASVLPQIPRKVEPVAISRTKTLQDALVGLLIGIAVMYMLL